MSTFSGEPQDTSNPDGYPQKLLDTNRINALVWNPKIELQDGLAVTISSSLRELITSIYELKLAFTWAENIWRINI